VTAIKAVHITELRTAVNQARARAGLAAANWAEAVAAGALVKAAHIVELRARLDEARAALGLPAASYTDPSLSAGTTTVKAVHVQELRQRVTEALAGYLSPIPTDGTASLAFNAATNRITTADFDYDKAGNQVRALAPGGGSQRFQYDAANRLVKVKADDNITVLATYTYGDSNERLIADEGGVRTYYAGNGGISLAEYTESGSSVIPIWSKSYVYLGARLLSALTPNGSGGEFVQYHHADRLGTRLVTNAQDTTYFEQVTLPFGTALNAESTGFTNRRFTSYDRSSVTGLDYAINRHYDPQQGRFTQVDPIGMSASSLVDPQSLNMYSYVGNDPVNHIDPEGLFSWKTFFKGLLLIHTFGLAGLLFFKSVRHAVVKAIHVVAQVVGRILNNRWVRIGVFIASFLVPFVGPALAAALQTALDIFNTIADIVQTLQLTDMLLQHKYAQFAASIATGLASSAISTIADRVIRGVTEALTKNGEFSLKNFTFKGFFSGVWSGLKLGLHDVFGRGWESLIPVYGRYCAPGLGVGPGETAPGVSGIDKRCRAHDRVYNASTRNAVRLDADKVLFKGLFTALSAVGVGDIVFGGRPSGGNAYRFVAIPLFGGVIVYRTVRP
jgi:RHS repeat-associated protein